MSRSQEEHSITIGSRGSDLALWQAHHVQDQLARLGHRAEIRIIKTQGDRIQHLSFDKMEGKGFFTKEIEAALLDGSIDLAVHSHKDLETTEPEGLTVSAVSDREDPSELLLIRPEKATGSGEFPFETGAVVGTSSARRKAQVLASRPDVQLKDIRGNVPTRIRKLREGEFDAILLAKAGVTRLGLDLSDLHVVELDPRSFIPAPAQGVLALQIRSKDNALHETLQALNDAPTAQTTRIERKVLQLFQGGCQLPLGVYCEQREGKFHLWAAMADAWDAPVRRGHWEADRAEGFAETVVEQLKKKAVIPSSSAGSKPGKMPFTSS